jgi:hypothetical protein
MHEDAAPCGKVESSRVRDQSMMTRRHALLWLTRDS